MVDHAGLMAIIAFIIIGLRSSDFSRVPTGFLPIEDQGYLLVAVQLPDGASLARTAIALDQVSAIAQKDSSVDQVIAISGISALDNNATLANAGVAYVVLKDWSVRDDLRTLFPADVAGAGRRRRAGDRAAAAADPGHRQCRRLHHAGRIARRQRPISPSCKASPTRWSPTRKSQSALQRVSTSFRAAAPQLRVEVDRVKAQTLHVTRRSGVLDARDLFRLDLCGAVQQIRPRVPGLRPGRRAIPAAAARHRKSVGAQSAGQHGPARHRWRRSRRRSARR